MMDRVLRAREFFKEGYNCAQAVSMAFCDLFEEEEQTVACAVSAFGGGFSRMREVCGAVSGITYVVGRMEGYSDPHNLSEKKRVYGITQELLTAFARENGSIVCRELLKPVGIVDGDRKGRPCEDLVASAAVLLSARYCKD